MAKNALVEQANGERTRTGNTVLPRVDIYETDQEILLQADVPGVAPGNVDLRYERGELTLHGKRAARPQTGEAILGENEAGDFYRVFQLHETIDASKIDAELKQGVLTVHLPKHEAVKPKLVTVKSA
ncbi:MAG: Hsp20/alpha crystallin family protein [Gemmataceae bacterium]|nr:Hsp20/alpha crystallin family protein [Gemmataceae bacterium]